MPEPNEEINEELPTDELKSVSGGLKNNEVVDNLPPLTEVVDTLPPFRSPQGSGSGMTRDDWKKSRQGMCPIDEGDGTVL